MVLAKHPVGLPQDDDFRLEQAPLPSVADGQLLIRIRFLGIEPRLRLILNPTTDWNKAMRPHGAMAGIGRVIPGSALGVVEASRKAGFQAGDLVEGMLGWQEYALTEGAPHPTNNPEGLRVCDRSQGTREEDHVAVLGAPGLTAYLALKHEGRLQPGETVVITSAAGMVGSIAGQLARRAGARVVGVTSSEEKLRYLTDELKFDAAISYRSPTWQQELDAATPDGVDYYFDNVGGTQADYIRSRLTPAGRVTRCGLVSKYTADQWDQAKEFDGQFSVHNHVPEYGEAREELSKLVQSGDLTYRLTILDGLASAPRGLRAVLEGQNIGRYLIRV
jgi:NADPH-dependent curcumin reductase CurA